MIELSRAVLEPIDQVTECGWCGESLDIPSPAFFCSDACWNAVDRFGDVHDAWLAVRHEGEERAARLHELWWIEGKYVWKGPYTGSVLSMVPA
jgi:hypothetical protein